MRLLLCCSRHFEARDLTLAELTREDFAAYIANHPGKPSTKRSILAAVRSYFAITQAHSHNDPTQGIRCVRSDRRRTTLAPALVEAVARLLDFINGSTRLIDLRDRVIFLLLMIQGLSVEALVGLKLSDYHREPENGRASLRVHAYGREGELALPMETADAIDAYLEATKHDVHGALVRVLRGKTNQSGGPLARGEVSRIIRKRAYALGLAPIGCRTLRTVGQKDTPTPTTPPDPRCGEHNEGSGK